jgi:6-phosphogluconolactonase (cycloisomerase 2 family)
MLLASAALFLLAACGGGGGGVGSGSGGSGPGTGPGDDSNAPHSLVYGAPITAYIAQVPGQPNTPSWVNIIDTFSVAPTLPAGLELDPITGVISGTPLLQTEVGHYTVTGTSEHGSTDTELEIRVTDSPVMALGTYGDGTLMVHRIDPFSGSLSPLGLEYAPDEAGALGDVVVHPAGHLAWTANNGELGSSQDVSVFSIAPQTGLPQYTSSRSFLEGAHTMGLSPDGTLAFVASKANHRIQSHTVDQITGELTAAITGTSPDRVIVDPRGRFVWCQNYHARNLNLFLIDQVTGELSPAGDLSFFTRRPTDMVLDDTGDHLYVSFEETSEIQRFRIDGNGTTGFDLVWGTRTTTGGLPNSLAIGPAGTFLTVTCAGSNELRAYAVNREDGELALASIQELDFEPHGVTMDQSGSYAYVSYSGEHEISSLRINPSNGSLTRTSEIRTRPGLNCLTILNASSPLAAVALNLYSVNEQSEDLSAFDVDPISGALTSSGPDQALGLRPDHLVLDPRGTAAWIANEANQTLSTVLLDDNGMVSNMPGTPVDLPGTPQGLAVDPSGHYIFVTLDIPGRLLVFAVGDTPSDLTLSQTVSLTNEPKEITCDSTGRFVHVSGAATIATLLFEQGQLSYEAAFAPAPGDPSGLRFAASGRHAYACLTGSHLVVPYSVQQTSGQLAPLAGAALTVPGTPIAFEPGLPRIQDSAPDAGAVVGLEPGLGAAYVILGQDPTSNPSLLTLTIHEDTQQMTLVEEIPLLYEPQDLRVNPLGTKLYVLDGDADRIVVHSIAPEPTLLSVDGFVPTGVAPKALVIRKGLE